MVAARASSAGGGGGGRRARGHSNRGRGGGGSDTEDLATMQCEMSKLRVDLKAALRAGEDAAKESAELKQMLTEEVGGRVCHVDDFSAQPEPICH